MQQWREWIPASVIEDLDNAKTYLIPFFRSPVSQIRFCPDWSWRTVLILQVMLSVAVGLCSGLVARSHTQVLTGIFILPINVIMGTFLTAAFFYYVFMFFFQHPADYRKTYILIALASIFHLVLLILSPLLPPIPLVGLAFTALLLVVGFSENFDLERKKLLKVVSALYVFIFLIWVVNTLQTSQRRQEFHDLATPESLDILEKEIKGQ